MKIGFPSPEFDDVVASVCHGSATDEHARALNELLRGNAGARDEYILRLELHSRLASDADLFAATDEHSRSSLHGEKAGVRGDESAMHSSRSEASGAPTPHPHSLSPLRGEGGMHCAFATHPTVPN